MSTAEQVKHYSSDSNIFTLGVPPPDSSFTENLEIICTCVSIDTDQGYISAEARDVRGLKGTQEIVKVWTKVSVKQDRLAPIPVF
jgi:hypothetical protein